MSIYATHGRNNGVNDGHFWIFDTSIGNFNLFARPIILFETVIIRVFAYIFVRDDVPFRIVEFKENGQKIEIVLNASLAKPQRK